MSGSVDNGKLGPGCGCRQSFGSGNLTGGLDAACADAENAALGVLYGCSHSTGKSCLHVLSSAVVAYGYA